jgi:hypothetical protein
MERGTYSELVRMYEELNRLNEEFDRRNLEIKDTYKGIEETSPERVRQSYNSGMNQLIGVSNNNEINIRSIDVIIGLLNVLKEKINTYRNTTQSITQLFNRDKIGTLEGLAREKLSDPQISIKNNGDTLAQTVLGQPYNELDAVRRKGGKKKQKTKKRRKYFNKSR